MKNRKAKPLSKVVGKLVFYREPYNVVASRCSGEHLMWLCAGQMGQLFPGIERALPLRTAREVTITIEFGKEV